MQTVTFPIGKSFIPLLQEQRNPISLASVARFGFDGGEFNSGVVYANNVIGLKNSLSSFMMRRINKVDERDTVEVILLNKVAYTCSKTRITNSTTGKVLLVHVSTDRTITVANVRNKDYVFIEGIGLFRHEPVNDELIAEDMLGMDIPNVLGIVSGGNRLIAYTVDTIRYGQIQTLNNFIPSTLDGAGGAQITVLRGEIVIVLETVDGFIVYTTQNAILARNTNTVLAPYRFDELMIAGIALVDHVSNSIKGNHLVFTGEGFYTVTANGTVSEVLVGTLQNLYKRILTVEGNTTEGDEITKAVSGKYDFHELSGRSTENRYSDLNNRRFVHKEVKVVAINRFLVVLVTTNVASLGAIYIYDTVTKKSGVTIGDYVDICDLGLTASTHLDMIHSANDLYSAIGAISSDNKLLSLDINNRGKHSASIHIGAFELSRRATMYVDSVYITDVEDHSDVSLSTSELPHEQQAGTELDSVFKLSGATGLYDANLVCKTTTVDIQGGFNLFDIRFAVDNAGSAF